MEMIEKSIMAFQISLNIYTCNDTFKEHCYFDGSDNYNLEGVYMVVKRYLAIMLASLLAVTSVNAGRMTALANDFGYEDKLYLETNTDVVDSESTDATLQRTADVVIQSDEDSSDVSELSEENQEQYITITFDANGGLFENGESTRVIDFKLGGGNCW